jgi:hypothetical protein
MYLFGGCEAACNVCKLDNLFVTASTCLNCTSQFSRDDGDCGGTCLSGKYLAYEWSACVDPANCPFGTRPKVATLDCVPPCSASECFDSTDSMCKTLIAGTRMRSGIDVACVSTCPQSPTYKTFKSEDSLKCVLSCPNYVDPVLQKCVASCGPSKFNSPGTKLCYCD